MVRAWCERPHPARDKISSRRDRPVHTPRHASDRHSALGRPRIVKSQLTSNRRVLRISEGWAASFREPRKQDNLMRAVLVGSMTASAFLRDAQPRTCNRWARSGATGITWAAVVLCSGQQRTFTNLRRIFFHQTRPLSALL